MTLELMPLAERTSLSHTIGVKAERGKKLWTLKRGGTYISSLNHLQKEDGAGGESSSRLLNQTS